MVRAFHPASVSELGFDAVLRAAVEPFPAATSVALSIDTAVDDRALAQSRATSVARDLVVNAIKHADPTRIDVTVTSSWRSTTTASTAPRPTARRRVKDAGGQLEIATRSDLGTHSRVILPASSDG